MLNSTALFAGRQRLLYGAVFLASGISYQAEAAQCEFKISNEWNSGFTSSVTISNDTRQEINGWTVNLEYPDDSKINNAWNTNISGDNPYQLSSKNYNARIQPGQSVAFGFNSQKANYHQPAPTPILSGICALPTAAMAPEANISASQQSGEIPLTVDFDASASSSQTSEISLYSWNFGDGNSARGATVSHTFEQPGDYNVQLIVTDANGESRPATVNITATPPQINEAQCEFSVQNEWNSGFTGQVRITNKAPGAIDGWRVVLTFPDTTTISGSWNAMLSGSNPYTLTNANHNGNINPGQSVQFGFNAQKGTSGASVSTPALSGLCGNSQNLPQNQVPVASAEASTLSGTAPLTVSFSSNGSNDPDGDVLNYLWSFGDGNQSSEANPRHIFTEPGNYSVRLQVSDGELQAESATINISVAEAVVTEPQSWQLDASKSSLWFVSTKQLHILESHTFTDISGEITSSGDASLTIALDSIESAIDIRNARMREHLFETSLFPEAQVMLNVDTHQLSQMASGSSHMLDVSALLNLHGVSIPVQTRLRVAKLPDGALLLHNLQPILLAAADFNLDMGINTLKQLAGLSSISYTVPVNFHLMFAPVQTSGN